MIREYVHCPRRIEVGILSEQMQGETVEQSVQLARRSRLSVALEFVLPGDPGEYGSAGVRDERVNAVVLSA